MFYEVVCLQGDPEEDDQGKAEKSKPRLADMIFDWEDAKPGFTWQQNRGPGEASTSGREHRPPDGWDSRPRGQRGTKGRNEVGLTPEDFHPKEYFGPKQRVWILCGGVGSGADMSLASGINVANILRNEVDLIVSSLLACPLCHRSIIISQFCS